MDRVKLCDNLWLGIFILGVLGVLKMFSVWWIFGKDLVFLEFF